MICFLSTLFSIVIVIGGGLIHLAIHGGDTVAFPVAIGYGVIIVVVMVFLSWLFSRMCVSFATVAPV